MEGKVQRTQAKEKVKQDVKWRKRNGDTCADARDKSSERWIRWAE